METSTKNISFIDILNKELVGKQIRICTSEKDIYQEYNIWKKKSKNVTDAQFTELVPAEGHSYFTRNPKYCISVSRTQRIGGYAKYEDFKIESVRIDKTNDEFEGHDNILLILENGQEYDIEIGDELVHIHSNLYTL